MIDSLLVGTIVFVTGWCSFLLGMKTGRVREQSDYILSRGKYSGHKKT